MDFPIPGSPPTSTSEPRTIPPPKTRSSSPIPVRILSSCVASISDNFFGDEFSCAAEEPVAERPREVAATVWIISSTIVFHALQPGHFPSHLIDSVPHSAQTNTDFVFINPNIIEYSGEQTQEEGCLSLPDVFAKTVRFKNITVEYYDQNLIKQTLKADDLLSLAIQHENDHLNNKFYIDKIPPLRKIAVAFKLNKIRERAKNMSPEPKYIEENDQ